MRITFDTDHTPKGQAPDRPNYKKGRTYNFDGPVAEGYARKYVERGLAHLAADNPTQADVQEKVSAKAAEEAQEEADRLKAEQDRIAARNAVEIPENWAELPWHAMKALAMSVSDEPVRSREDVRAAIEAELQRRAA